MQKKQKTVEVLKNLALQLIAILASDLSADRISHARAVDSLLTGALGPFRLLLYSICKFLWWEKVISIYLAFSNFVDWDPITITKQNIPLLWGCCSLSYSAGEFQFRLLPNLMPNFMFMLYSPAPCPCVKFSYVINYFWRKNDVTTKTFKNLLMRVCTQVK